MGILAAYEYLIQSYPQEFVPVSDYPGFDRADILYSISAAFDVIYRLFDVVWRGFLEETEMACVDPYDRGLRESAFVYETEECTVAAYTCQEIGILAVFRQYLITARPDYFGEFFMNGARMIFMIAEYIDFFWHYGDPFVSM